MSGIMTDGAVGDAWSRRLLERLNGWWHNGGHSLARTHSIIIPARSGPSVSGSFSISIVIPFKYLIWVSLESLLCGALLLQRFR